MNRNSYNKLGNLDLKRLSLQNLVRAMTLTRSMQSTQSTCYFFRSVHGEQIVIKLFNQEYVNATMTDARREFEALLLFNERIDSNTRIRAPKPLMLLPSGEGYVMEALEGLSLNEALENNSGFCIDEFEVAKRIIEGLQIFHECTAEPYADFQARNILLDDLGRVGFIDPTIPNQFFYEVAKDTTHALLAADIGYWLFSVAAEITKKGLFRPRWVLRLSRFTVLLVEAALRVHEDTTPSHSLLALTKVAYRHASRFKTSGQVKPFLLWLAMRPILWQLENMCRKRFLKEREP